MMLKKTLLFMVLSIFTLGAIAQSGSLKGKILDKENGEPIPFANISLLQSGKVVTGGMTDFDGKFNIKPIAAGVYDVKATYVGYKSLQISGLRVTAGKITFQDFKLASSAEILEEVEVVSYKVPLISKDQTSSGGTVTADEIAKMPGRSAESVASTVGGVLTEDGSVSSIRGSREDATVYYIDGMKVRGSNTVPKSALEQVSVITGGIPAKYGDATGGIIEITTKGAQKKLFGGVELVTSHFLDNYNYNLAEAYLSGPLFSVKKKDPNDSTKTIKEPIIDYFISGSGLYFEDPQMSAVGYYKAPDELRESFMNAPYTFNNQDLITQSTADYYRADDFTTIKTAENGEKKSISAQGKIGINPSKAINITIGGTYDYNNQRIFDVTNTLFNSNNNGQSITQNWRAYARLTHKFGTGNYGKEEEKASVFKNTFYTLQVDYSSTSSKRQDINHKDNLFNYGYNGKYTTYRMKTYEWTDTMNAHPTGVWMQNGFMDTLVTFSATEENPEVGNYTEYLYEMIDGKDQGSSLTMNKTLLEQFGAIMNGSIPDRIYDSNTNRGYNSPGAVYDLYNNSQNTQFRFTGSGSTDIKDHEVSLGFEFEQRTDAYYGINPAQLWTIAEQNLNKHIVQLDLNNPMYNNDTVKYNRLYNSSVQSEFDINFRKALNESGEYIDGKLVSTTGTEWIDLDTYNPDQLKIDYFSPDELLNDGSPVVFYQGFDAYGNRIKGNSTLNDFFTETYTDDLGNTRYSRKIDAFKPSYAAFYIQDKFAFNDLVFNVGLRVDRYDANQMVLKDMYLLHDAKTIADIVSEDNGISASDLPSGIDESAIVYVNNFNDFNGIDDINGYRVGSNPAEVTWYNTKGEQVTDFKKLESATGLNPLLKNPAALEQMKNTNINAYEDYKPQYTVMPRIAFSFPISDEALFMAHYDVLTQRPGSNSIDPLAYMYIDKYGMSSTLAPINNPNLKPTKTINYEIGFQQKLNNSSSLKLSGFYKEMRDMIQTQKISGSYPADYMTYTNVDFGTVKGLTITYDLRRTGNITLRLSYTLQFANGTGSNAETGKALAQTDQPNLRTTMPLDFDNRHAIAGNIDYRFASGKLYNGPRWFGMDFFQNTGANATVRYMTGKPYSRKDPNTEYLIGSLNGSRQPSTFFVDIKIDKTIPFTFGKEDNKKHANVNIYFLIENLFNSLNIRYVYSKTGNANDDGYLTAAINQGRIESQTDPQSYKDYYSMKIGGYHMYYNPRTIRFGVSLNF